MSAMSGGTAQSAATSSSGKSPWVDFDAEEENEKQKKHQRLKGKKEELVGEVINYLLNKEATL